MNVGNFLGELKRRNVYRVAVSYAVVSWLLIQVATQVSPFFSIPNSTVRVIILLLVVCFPVALAFAWVYELTPQGIKRTEDVPPQQSIRRHTARKLVAFTTVVAALAISLLLIRSAGLRALLDDRQPVQAEADAYVPDKSIAVLPFANLAAEPENAFFADGIQDEILAQLARVADLKVISRTSVAAYKSGAARNLRQIGRELGVAHVLEGSVQRLAHRVRVTVQLIDARTDAHVWADSFDRELADAFAIQSDIAAAVARELNTTLFARTQDEQPTHDVQAFDLYLRAKQLITTVDDAADRKEALLQALRLLDEAISRDSKFALAYCWATTAHDNLYWFGLDNSPARLAAAKAAAQTALALAPDLGEAHLAQALVYYHGNRDYPRAIGELQIARTKLPNSAEVYSLLGWIARRQGRWDDAVKFQEKAAELDPRNQKVLAQLSILYDLLRRYDDKEALYDRSLALNPTARDNFQLYRAWTELEKGNLAAAHTALDSLEPDYDPAGAVSSARIMLALYERHPEAASAILANLKTEEIAGDAGLLYPVSWFEALIARAKGDSATARNALTIARAKLETKLRDKPDDALVLAQVSVIDAGLGNGRDAISEALRAVQLRPLDQDALDGATVLSSLAEAYAWDGDIESALAQLTILAKTPGGPDYGQLKWSPMWDAVRNDARFAQIVAGLEPQKKSK